MFGATSGYRNDGDAGLSHIGARYYDAQVGRFISRDTYLDQKPYLYCEHDPVNHLDPSGHFFPIIILIILVVVLIASEGCGGPNPPTGGGTGGGASSGGSGVPNPNPHPNPIGKDDDWRGGEYTQLPPGSDTGIGNGENTGGRLGDGGRGRGKNDLNHMSDYFENH